MAQNKTIINRVADWWFGPRPPKQKAMADLHPEFAAREMLLSTRGGTDMWVAAVYPYLQAVADSESNVWMRKAVKIIADAIAPLNLEVVAGDTVIENAPALDLLDKPNETQSPADFWREWSVDMMLGGESGVELVQGKGGGWLEMWTRQPHQFQVIPDPKRKRYRLVAGYIVDDQEGDPYDLAPEEFAHFKLYNPRNRWRGVSPFIAARMGMKIDKHAREWARDFFENSARPDIAVVAPEGSTVSERDTIRRQVLADYRGSQTGVIVTEDKVMDVKPISYSPKDIDFVPQREMSRDEVAAAAGIPDILMGFGNDSYDTPDKRTNAEATMWSLTIKPLIEMRDQALTAHFLRIGLLADGQEIRTNLSDVAALKENFGQQLANAQMLYGMNVPFNVIDDRLKLGIGAIPGGDVGAADRNPFGTFGLPSDQPTDAPPATPLPAQLSAGIRVIDPMMRVKGLAVPKGKAVELGSELHRQMWELSEKRVRTHVLFIQAIVRDIFDAQRDEVLARLAAQKTVKSVAQIGDDPFDLTEWIRESIQRIKPGHERALAEAGANALDDVGVALDFNLTNPRVTAWLRRAAQRFAKRVTETTWQALRESLAQGIDAGEGVDKLSERVTATMELRANQSAEAIARTETASAATSGTIEGWRQSGVVSSKTWIATFDSRVRDTHADAHGQTVTLDGNFKVGSAEGPGPGLMDEAGESINCRCTTIAQVD